MEVYSLFPDNVLWKKLVVHFKFTNFTSIRISSQPMPTPDFGFGKSLADRSDLNIIDKRCAKSPSRFFFFLMCLPSFTNIFFGLFTRWLYEIIQIQKTWGVPGSFFVLFPPPCFPLLPFCRWVCVLSALTVPRPEPPPLCALWLCDTSARFRRNCHSPRAVRNYGVYLSV